MIMRIREARIQAGLSQKDVALRMGVVQNCVSQWEMETFLPRARQIPQLADVLGCEIGALFQNNIEKADTSIANEEVQYHSD